MVLLTFNMTNNPGAVSVTVINGIATITLPAAVSVSAGHGINFWVIN
jgi:hypothetical protein